MNLHADYEQAPPPENCSWSLKLNDKVLLKRDGFGDYFEALRDFREFKKEVFVLPLVMPGKRAPSPSDN